MGRIVTGRAKSGRIDSGRTGAEFANFGRNHERRRLIEMGRAQLEHRDR